MQIESIRSVCDMLYFLLIRAIKLQAIENNRIKDQRQYYIRGK